MNEQHIPVLCAEITAALLPGSTDARIIDGTLGAGGHTQALLEAGAQAVLGLDVDPQALEIARERLAPYGQRVQIVQSSYVSMREVAHTLDWEMVDGILLDLGASSMQFDTPERGFAFQHEGPLDMRFDPTGGTLTAAEIVNTWSEADLADLLYRYGEETESRRLARAIVQGRPHSSTRGLAECIAGAIRPRRGQKGGGIHPATRSFQALRIAVNDELRSVEAVLPLAINLLRPGGRLAVITFHSLEDRIVKQVFRRAAEEFVPPPGMASLGERRAVVRELTRKPVLPADEEVARNPRSRSAKLRVVEKI